MKDLISNNLSLHSEEYPFALALRVRDFPDEKSFVRFIRSCERMVRNSIEYREWRRYIFDVLGLTACSLTYEDREDVTIEIHHAPISLFTIIRVLINEKIFNDQEFSSFEIAMETMILHFQNSIGYVPLITSMHEKVHNGKLKIPIELIRGNYQEFINKFWNFIDESDQKTIAECLTTHYEQTNYNWGKDFYPGLFLNVESKEEFAISVSAK